MSDPTDRTRTGAPDAPDAAPGQDVEPMPIPGAAGPVGGSPTGELVDGIDQPIDLPGERPPLSTD